MNNQNLIKPKMGEIQFSPNGSNIAVPENVQIEDVKPKYHYENGEATTQINSIALTLVDKKFLEIAKAANYDITQAPTFYGEIQDKDLVAQLQPKLESLVGIQLPTANAKISLRWVSFGNSGNWGGLKLILTREAFAAKKV